MNVLKNISIAVALIICINASISSADDIKKDFAGLYIGEMHGGKNQYDDYIDMWNRSSNPCEYTQIGGSFKSKGKSRGFHVELTPDGKIHILVFDRYLWFTGITPNYDVRGEVRFEAKAKNYSIEGRIVKDLFDAVFQDRSQKKYIAARLSCADKRNYNIINQIAVGGRTIEDLLSEISQMEKAINNIKNQHEVQITTYENDLTSLKKDLTGQINALNNKLLSQPFININNISLSEHVNTEVDVKRGPESNTEVITTLKNNAKISKLREVRNDSTWSLIATSSGRLGYIPTRHIMGKRLGAQTPPKPDHEGQIVVSSPGGVKENDIVHVSSKGPQTIKGTVNIENVSDVYVNDKRATKADNYFRKTVDIKSGQNKIVIKVETHEGKHYEYKFTIKAP